jgi:hypothetical protein
VFVDGNGKIVCESKIVSEPDAPARHAARQAQAAGPGLTPRVVLDKLAAIQMLDVHFPTR